MDGRMGDRRMDREQWGKGRKDNRWWDEKKCERKRRDKGEEKEKER